MWILGLKGLKPLLLYIIVPSTSFAAKACRSRKKENALSFNQVEQMLFNFMKLKQTWKSNYSTIRLFFLV